MSDMLTIKAVSCSLKPGDVFTADVPTKQRPWWAFWRKKPAPTELKQYVVSWSINGQSPTQWFGE